MKEKGEELNLPVSNAVKKEEKSYQAYPIYPDGDDITKTYKKINPVYAIGSKERAELLH